MSQYYLERAMEVAQKEHNAKNEKELLKCIKKLSSEEFLEFEKFTLELAYPGYLDKLYNDLNFQAKVIASYVRENIEDFHCEHLNDAQMKELNPLIRNAIYTALRDIMFRPTRTYAVQKLNLAPYWEDCEYLENM